MRRMEDCSDRVTALSIIYHGSKKVNGTPITGRITMPERIAGVMSYREGCCSQQNSTPALCFWPAT